MKIWGRANSVNVKKALWAAEELGLDYERIEAGGAFGVVGTPEYKTMNPNGVVPLLEDGDLLVWESNAIVRYLAAQYGAGTLWPDAPAERALGDRWMDWCTSSLALPFRDVFWNLVRIAPAERDLALIERGRATCSTLLARADAALATAPYLSGARFAMGDIPLGCFAYAWFNLDMERPDLPHLADWYARLTDRPAFQKAVMTPVT